MSDRHRASYFFLIVGVALVLTPFVTMSEPTQSNVIVQVDQVGSMQLSDSDQVRAYEELDASSSRAFDAASQDFFLVLGSKSDRQAASTFTSISHVRHEGNYYNIRAFELPLSYSPDSVITNFLLMFGTLFLAWGLLIRAVGSLRPFTLWHSFIVPVACAMVLVLYPDTANVGIGPPTPAAAMAFFPIPLFFVSGIFVDHGHLSAPVTIFGLAIVGYIIGVVMGYSLVVLLLLIAAVFLAGSPWFVFGLLGSKGASRS